MSSYAAFKKKSLENPEVRKAYEELQPEYDIISVEEDSHLYRWRVITN